MTIYLIIYSLVLLAVIYHGLKRIRITINWRNVIEEEQLKILQQIRNKIK